MTHNRWLLVGLIAVALAAAVGIQAQEGHSHRIMGSVSAVRPGGHLEIRTTEGQTVTVMLGRETRILRGSSPAVAENISAGARVVAIFTEQGNMKMASEVRLGQAGPEKQQAPEAASPPLVRDGENEGAGRLGPEGDGEGLRSHGRLPGRPGAVAAFPARHPERPALSVARP